MSNARAVAFLGPIGHGKSRLVNKVCGTAHASSAGASSCTRSLEVGVNKTHNLFVIGTPGFGSSEDIASHIAAQKFALEGVPLSGVYAVIRYESRADAISRQVETLMDFLGDDNVRVIVTHADHASNDDGFGDLKQVVANNLDIPQDNICFVGKDTPGDEIAQFIKNTLHDPLVFTITETQIAAVSGLSGIRKYNKPINRVLAHIKVAAETCEKLIASSGKKSYETDLTIIATQNLVRKKVAESKEDIFREASENIASEVEQNLVYGKAGVSLSIALQNFIKTTNAHLSWDITNPRDPRNIYRKCPHCDAVYVLVAGCLNVYKCGGEGHIPDGETPKSTEKVCAEFVCDETIWIRYKIGNLYYHAEVVKDELSKFTKMLTARARKDKEAAQKLEQATKNGTRELNIFCGNKYTWNESHILTPAELKVLGEVEFDKAGELEIKSARLFRNRVEEGVSRNKSVLKEGMKELDLDGSAF